jgi:hypothetical protein
LRKKCQDEEEKQQVSIQNLNPESKVLDTCDSWILMLATSRFGDRVGTVASHDESSELFVTHGIADSVQ